MLHHPRRPPAERQAREDVMAIRRAILVLALLWLGATAAVAQTYPSRTVRMVVPQSAGGVTDVIARAVAQKLGEMWGQQIVVENKPGANYQIGTAAVAKADPDGYTLLVTSEAYTINPLRYSNPTYRSEARRV